MLTFMYLKQITVLGSVSGPHASQASTGPSEHWSCGLWMSWQSSLKRLAEHEGCKLRFCGSSSTTRSSDWRALSSAGPVCLHSTVLGVPPFMSLLHLFHTVLFRLWPRHHLPTSEFLKVSLKKKLCVIGTMAHTLWTQHSGGRGKCISVNSRLNLVYTASSRPTGTTKWDETLSQNKMWVLGIELRSPSLASSAFTQ